jgi:hypothetical protein
MAFKASSVGSEDNRSSGSIYDSLRMKSKRAVKSLSNDQFLKCCLFTINLWNKEIPTKESLNDWENSIKKFIVKEFDDNKSKELNLSYLNALLYQNYLSQKKSFFNYQYLKMIFYININKNYF